MTNYASNKSLICSLSNDTSLSVCFVSKRYTRGGIGTETSPLGLPVVLKVIGVVSMKSIDMYIPHDRSDSEGKMSKLSNDMSYIAKTGMDYSCHAM